MHLIIQGHHLTVTPAINSYVKTKMKKITNHFDGIIHAHVMLEASKEQQTAEVTITSGHHHFHNKVKSEDLYKSIDFLFDKIERQVRRYKEHKADKNKKQEKLTYHLQEIEENETSELKIADVEISNKPMNDLEAVLQLSVDPDLNILGFFSGMDSSVPNYLIKVNSSEFTLFHFDEYWEKKELRLINQNQLDILEVTSLKPSLESIEHALDFLDHTNDLYRFFISVRTGKSMLLHKIGKNQYELIRETI